MRPCNQFTKR